MNIFEKYLKGEKNKVNLYILIAAVLVFVVIFFSFEDGDKKPKSEAFGIATQNDVEKRLTKILKEIDGIGKVSVMISYEKTSEKVVLSDEEKRYGDDREEKSTKSVVTKDEVFVTAEIYPTVRGVIVACDGANKSDVKAKVLNAVSCALGISMHKIAVV